MLRLTGRSMKLTWRLAVTILVLAWLGAAFAARAQDNYEIQVYGSETVEKGHTMVELHGNFYRTRQYHQHRWNNSNQSPVA